MGKKVNFDSLTNLYAAATQFKSKIHGTVERIQVNITKLTDPNFTAGLQGGQGDEAIKAIKAGQEAVEELMNAINRTRSLIDKKIGDAHRTRADKQGFSDAASAQRQNAANLRFKRK